MDRFHMGRVLVKRGTWVQEQYVNDHYSWKVAKVYSESMVIIIRNTEFSVTHPEHDLKVITRRKVPQGIVWREQGMQSDSGGPRYIFSEEPVEDYQAPEI